MIAMVDNTEVFEAKYPPSAVNTRRFKGGLESLKAEPFVNVAFE